MTASLLDPLIDARLDALLDAVVEGTPLLMHMRRPDTASRLLHRARTGPWMLDTAETSPEGGQPVSLLLAAGNVLGAAADDLQALVASPALDHALLLARTSPRDAGAWVTAAGLWASLRRANGGSGPALVLLGADLGCPAGCQAFDDGDLFGPAESALIARWARPAGGLIAQAANAAAIEVARGDPLLLSRLLELGDGERLDPTAWLTRQSVPATPDPLPWRGTDACCPIWLARVDRPALRRRIWRGHLFVLLPWLEEVRADFLVRGATRLHGGPRDPTTGDPVAPADYEWGQIVTALRAGRTPLANDADTLRRVRNALAHGDPAPPEDCRRIEPAARRLLAWR